MVTQLVPVPSKAGCVLRKSDKREQIAYDGVCESTLEFGRSVK